MNATERRSQWPLAAREHELEAFEQAWADQNCKGVVIVGPAGVGKSRLAAECQAAAARKGWSKSRATASVAAAAIPLGALAHLIPNGVDLTDPVRAFAAAARRLSERNQRRWAVWVDDLHLLDTASAVLLSQLLDAGLVRLIGTVRSEGTMSDSVLALTRSDAIHRIDLSVLDRAGVATVLHAALGTPAGIRTVREFHTASGGNLLYLRELVVAALQAGRLTNTGEIWELADGHPGTTPKLSELILARLEGAGSQARPLLNLLALCQSVPLADARTMVSFEVLADLEENGLIQVTQSRRRTTLRLAHPLYEEILRASIPAVQRRRLLLDQAERTQRHGARRRDDALHIASWHLAATGTADPRMLQQAVLLARHAHDYPRAIELLEALPEEHRTTHTRLLHGATLQELGHPEAAEAVLAQAAAQAANETERLAAVFGQTLTLAMSQAKTTEALAVVTAAAARVTSPAGERLLKAHEGTVRVIAGDLNGGLDLLRYLDEDIKNVPEINFWLMAATMKSAALALTGHTHEALLCAERAYTQHIDVAERAAIAPHPAAHKISAVLALTEAGRINEARTEGEEAFHALADVQASGPRMWIALNLARAEWLAGHCASARRWYAEAAALARSGHQKSGLRLAVGGMAACAALSGDRPAAESLIAERDHCPSVGLYSVEDQLADAWLMAAAGDVARARQKLHHTAGIARASGHLTTEAMLLTDAARLGGAAQVTDRLTELARFCDGRLAPARARFAVALDDADPEQLVEVATELEEIGADLMATEAAMAATAHWRDSGHTRRAAAADQQAARTAVRCREAHTPLLTTGASSATSLTQREREVALLAAAGARSKEIAAALQLSVRTVDNHLQRVYTKIGITTRRELATAFKASSVSRTAETGGGNGEGPRAPRQYAP